MVPALNAYALLLALPAEAAMHQTASSQASAAQIQDKPQDKPQDAGKDKPKVVEALPQQLAPEQKAPDAAPAPEKPIISDSDFTAALPPLDATAAPESAPGTPSPVPPVAETQLPPVAAPDDQELTAALPSINGYDVQAVQATGPAAEALPQIHYVVAIDGLKEIGEYDRFKSLSSLQAGKGKAANAAMVRARANEDQALALRLMKSAGYYDGTVSATITAPADGDGPIQAQIVAKPGKAYHLGTIAIDSQPTVPPDLIRGALPLKTGDIIVADQVIAAEANVSLVLPQRGYPFAKVLDRDITLDPETAVGDYSLKVDIGNRSRFGAIHTDGKMAFDAKHIAVLRRFNDGDLYDSRQVDDLRQALISTSLFRTVAVEPTPTGIKDADGVEVVDLTVHQQSGPPRTLAGEVGYSTGEGFTAQGSWTHRNLFPPEGALILTGKLGTQEQGLGATFRRSNDRRRDRTFQVGVSADHNIYDSYQAYTTGVTASVARVSTPIWQKVWTWSYGAELLTSREKATVTGTTLSAFETYYLANIPLKIGYDRTNDLLDPAMGFRLAAQGGPQISLSGGGSSLRAVVDGSCYYPIGGNIVIASRARVGSLLGADLASIAPSRRMYAGGGGSVRGFGYQGLGPLDAKGNPTGGRSLFEASVEMRYRWGDYGIVPFVDMGQVYDAQFPQFSDMRVGVGIGGRLYTNFGPIRIDVATPIDRRATEPQFALYVGIGQAF